MDFDVPPPDEALLAATWTRIKPPTLHMGLAEALRHPIFSICLRAAARGKPTPPARAPRPPSTVEPDLFSE